MGKTVLAPDVERLRLLGEVLRAARLRGKLTVRDCADLVGISPQTVSNAEHGIGCRASTLRAYLERLPGLTPEKLLDLPPTDLPVASSSAWAAHRELCGYVARRALVRVHVLGPGRAVRLVLVEGLRSIHAGMDSVAVRAALCRVASDAAPKSLAEVGEWEPGTTGRLVDDNGVHAWRIPFDVDEGITCWSRRMVSDFDWPGWVAALPVEQLDLRLHGVAQAARGGRIRCWPTSIPIEPETDIADALYRDAHAISVEGNSLAARVTRPAPLVHHVLVPGAQAQGRAGASLADRVQSRRVELGLGLKGAARVTGCSANALRGVEAGADPGADTLRRIVSGLGIPANQVLPPGCVEGASGLHDWLRCLHGVEASALVKTLVVYPDGTAESRIETRGLRSLRQEPGDLRLRVGLARAALQLHPDLLDEIEADGDMRLRVVRRQRGRTEHELRFPVREVLTRGITYTRRLARSPQFPMTREAARAMFGPVERYECGTSLAVLHPARLLRLIVRLPRAFRPANVRPHVWTVDMVPDSMAPQIVGLPSPKITISRTDRHLVATLVVHGPLVGFKYGIGWDIGD